MPKGVPLGPRVTVAVGKSKKGKTLYSFMLESTAKNFGFPFEKKTVTRKSKTGGLVIIRGSFRAKSIKVPAGKNKKTKKGHIKYLQIPMPVGMTIPKIQAFLQKATKNKPTTFISDDGLHHSAVAK